MNINCTAGAHLPCFKNLKGYTARYLIWMVKTVMITLDSLAFLYDVDNFLLIQYLRYCQGI